MGEIPLYLDYKKKGYVTAVKDQGSCGSCWAFAAASALESAHAIKFHELVPISKQQILDCSIEYDGCTGADVPEALNYAKKFPILSEKMYPYREQKTECKD